MASSKLICITLKFILDAIQFENDDKIACYNSF